jgi:hypothetical protein
MVQVATDLLECTAVGHPTLFHEQPNVRVHLDEATGIDLVDRDGNLALATRRQKDRPSVGVLRGG